MTPLDKTLKRLLRIEGREFVLTLTPDSLRLSQKGHRNGLQFTWASLVNGERALVTALQASVSDLAERRSAPPRKLPAKKRARR